MIKKIFIGLCLIFSIASSFALQKIYIFHINGVNTTQAEANKNREALNTTLNAQSNMISNNGQVDLLYNSNGTGGVCPLCTQLNDVFSQKKYENITVDDYVMAYIKANKLNIKPGTPEYTTLKNSIKNKYFADPAFMGNNFTDILNELHKKLTVGVNTSYLTNYLAARATNGGKPYILLIPHSQGNLYANNLYKKLTTDEGYNQSNLSIYGIASPAAKNLGDYISKSYYSNPGYITSNYDRVINSLRVLAVIPPQQDIAAATITIPEILTEPTGHSLIGTYLANSKSKQLIATNLYNIVHYFWMSDIYSNFTQTVTSGSRILNPELSLVATQDAGSTLSIAGILANGNCLNGNPYFVVRDTTYDTEMGSGMQCASGARGTIQLNSSGFSDNNRLRIKIAAGVINQKSIAYMLGPYQICINSLNWQNVLNSGGLYNGIVGGTSMDGSCERNGYGNHIPPGDPRTPTREQLLNGSVGTLQL